MTKLFKSWAQLLWSKKSWVAQDVGSNTETNENVKENYLMPGFDIQGS